MNYLEPSELAAHGVPADVPEHVVALASSLIDAHCRRASVAACEYNERLRVGATGRMRLTYLPVIALVSAQARYAAPRNPLASSFADDVATAFRLPGTWTALDVNTLEVCTRTGEVTVAAHPLGFAYNEVEIVYRAGYEAVPDAVKSACAAVIRNALATPGLNVRSAALDRMHVEYFADTLLDATVRALLAPFVARKVG